MTKKTQIIITLALGAVLVCPKITQAQTTIIFDDLGFSGLYEQIPNGYAGLEWNNFAVLNTVNEQNSFGRNGDVNGVVSPNNVAFNLGGNPAFISDMSFNLNSAYLMAAWNEGLQVEVQGFVGTKLTYDNTYIVNTSSSRLVNFNYFGVDEVNFISSGGVPHGYTFGHGTQFAMDNLTVTVPEPGTMGLLIFGVLAISLGGKLNSGHSPSSGVVLSKSVSSIRCRLTIKTEPRRQPCQPRQLFSGLQMIFS